MGFQKYGLHLKTHYNWHKIALSGHLAHATPVIEFMFVGRQNDNLTKLIFATAANYARKFSRRCTAASWNLNAGHPAPNSKAESTAFTPTKKGFTSAVTKAVPMSELTAGGLWSELRRAVLKTNTKNVSKVNRGDDTDVKSIYGSTPAASTKNSASAVFLNELFLRLEKYPIKFCRI